MSEVFSQYVPTRTVPSQSIVEKTELSVNRTEFVSTRKILVYFIYFGKINLGLIINLIIKSIV